jgi:hypothetical protein
MQHQQRSRLNDSASLGTPESARRTRPWGRCVVAYAANGQPRTFRLVRARSRAAAYRRLAVAIIGLDVESLAAELRAVGRVWPRRGGHAPCAAT